ncbi:CHAT domain-containing protein [Floridanema aerugineum]|uniref:CHAT domain-containing protein n=1 Tax=Floridaenema aerugineum BLCC-F46 TaxID=3153654 RepID=A0ABV4X4S0_9CYAN
MPKTWKSLSLINATLIFSFASPLKLIGTTPKISEAIPQAKINQVSLDRSTNLQRETVHQFDSSQFKVAARVTLIPTSPVQLQKKLQIYQEALATYREKGDRTGEANTLNQIGTVYTNLKEHSKALEFHQQALAIYKEIGDRTGEANTLNQIGTVYTNLKEYSKALEFHQQALTIYRQIGDRKGEAETFGYTGNVYFKAGQYRQVEELFRQQLESLRLIGDKKGEKLLLNVMGYYLSEEWGINAAFGIASGKNINERLREGRLSWQNVLEISKLTLFIIKQGNNSKKSCLRYAQTLHGIGWAYRNLGHYAQALDFYQQALKCQEYGEQNQETKLLLLIDIGTVYIDLAQYDLALENLRKSCSSNLTQPCHYIVLARIGLVYKKLGQYDVAFQYLQEALTLSHTQYDKQILLNYIGEFYAEIGEYSKALKFYNDALKSSISGEQSARGFILNNIALIHLQTGNNTQALETYQQALALFRELDDRPGQRLTLSNIGLLLEKQNQPELAIVFYKEAVNITQTIRQGLRELTLKEQEFYTKTIANTYRSLANLLLSQGRLLEAQQVLELLKIQEIRDFTRNAQVGEQLSGIALNQIEEKIIKEHGSLVSFGQKLADCQKTQCAQKEQLIAQRTFLTQAYNQAVRTLESEIAARKNRDSDFLNPRNDLNRKAQEIIKAQPGTLLIYPFVLEDKLWLLMASEGEIVKKFEVEVGQQELGETVLKFRQLLSKPSTSIDEIKQTSQKLYNWLIKPLEPELKSNKQRPIKHLVFALDRVTRYIPMSALFDGKQYLVENYAISTIVSAGFTDTIDRLPSGTQNVSVLALGLSREVPPDFDALKNVPVELDAIVKTRDRDSQGIYPGLKFLNQEFDFNTIQNNLYDRNILHIATHGEFVPGSVEASYLLLGTGEKLAIPQIENLNNLGNVHLVVLSACETALGGPGNDGIEIAGISHYFLARGAKSVLSSLWKVNDASTSYLMQQFYENLAKSTFTAPVSKAEALRQAQIALITKNFSVVSTPRGEDARIDVISTQTGLPAGVSNNLSHPYYWAPFILIGNAL